MADSENRTVHFQYKTSSMWSLILSIHIVMSGGNGSTKNKFELDRLDQDNHWNHTERYLV